MKYIIVDLEATCWENKITDGRGQKISEIIEIGALRINENGAIESEFSEFVKPVLNTELSEFCRTLTTISQTEIDAAEKFDRVIERFKNWMGKDEEIVLCSWGFYDKKQFLSDCNLHLLDTSWLVNHISLKHQFAEIRRLKKPPGMSGALLLENLIPEGVHHRGIDDARNIAKLFLRHFKSWRL